MRDARIARAQKRGDRRNRGLARRRVAPLFAFFVDAFTRLAAATLCASFALILWDLVSQSGTQHRVVRALIGAVFALVALFLVATVSGPVSRDFSIIAIPVFLAGLTVDALIGDRVRAGIGLRR
ncbi:MAG TPA: hypothetical protein VFN49_12320 [Candidatus Aquilonibacter sp.]|nr:hypothetical protein [Candidatus Aquilonibacter sp.]